MPRTTLTLLFLLTLVLSPMSARSQAEQLPWRNKGSPFGVVAALGNRVRAEDVDAAVSLMGEAGVQWQREELFWDRVQKEPGGPIIWNGDGSGFYDYDRVIGAQVAAGINILGLLDYNPAWFKGQNPPPEAWIEDWGNFVYAAVAHYGRDRGWIKHWELWNEPNLREAGYESGLYKVKDFVRILEVGRAAVKSADPEAKIVMGGMAGLTEASRPFDYDSLDYLDQVGKLGGWDQVDIIAIHPYHPAPPEDSVQRFDRRVNLRDELRHLDQLMLRYGSKPVWITELGWTTSSLQPGVSEETQALFLIRAYLLALGHPSVEKIFWYDFRNDTYPDLPYDRPAYNEREYELHYGLLRRSYPLDPNRSDLRKPAFAAYRTLATMLGGLILQRVAFDGSIPEVPGFYWYRFGSDNRSVDVLWRTGEAIPVFTVNCDCREAVVRSWNGRVQHIVYAHNGQLTIHPDAPGLPIYIEYDPPTSQDGHFFAETGHGLRGAFLAHWNEGGGVIRFGYPLTEEVVESEAGTGRPRVVQYFERARFEHFPELAATASEVQSGNINLGELAWQQQRVETPLPSNSADVPPECQRAATGYIICPPFRSVWQQYAGVAPLGNPISAPFAMTNSGTGKFSMVQYFEHARLEHFPEQAGTPFEVQFGLVGREVFTRVGGMP